MPWTMESAGRHTKKATTAATKRQWAKTANAVLQKTGDEGKAVRIANAAIAKHPSKKRAKKGGK